MTSGRGRSFGSVLALCAVAACGGGTTTGSTAETTGGEAPPPPAPTLVPQVVHGDGASWALSEDGRLLYGHSRYARTITDVPTGVTRIVRADDLGTDGSVSEVRFLAPDVVASCVNDGYSEGCVWSVWDVGRDLVVGIVGDIAEVPVVLLEGPRRVASFVSGELAAGPGTWALRIAPFEGSETLSVPLDPENLPYTLWASANGRFVAYALASEELVLLETATGLARPVVGTTLPPAQDSSEPDPRRFCTAFFGFSPEGALALMDDGSLVHATASGDRSLATCVLQADTLDGYPDRVAVECGEPTQLLWLDLATASLRPRGPAEPVVPPLPDGAPAADPLSSPHIMALIDQVSLAREHSVWSVTVDDGEIRVQHREFADALSAGGWTRLSEGAPDPYGSSYGSDYGSTAGDYSTSYEDTSSGYEDTATGEEEYETEEEEEEAVTLEEAGPPDPDAGFDDSAEAHEGEPCWIGRMGDGSIGALVLTDGGETLSEFPFEGTSGALGVESSIVSSCEMASVIVGQETLLFAETGDAYAPVGRVAGRGLLVWADERTAIVVDDAGTSHRIFDVATGRTYPITSPSGSCFAGARVGDHFVWRTAAGLETIDLRTGETARTAVADASACGLAVEGGVAFLRSSTTPSTLSVFELPTLSAVASYAIPSGAAVGNGLVVRCGSDGLEVRDARSGAMLRSAPTCEGTLATDFRFVVRTSPWRGRALVERVIDGATLEVVGLAGGAESIVVYASNGALWVADPAHLAHAALRGPGPALTAPMTSGAALAANHYRPTLLADFLEGRPLPAPGAPSTAAAR